MKRLGNSRDYKSRDKYVTANLKKHNALMQVYIKEGMDKATASSKAYLELFRDKVRVVKQQIQKAG